MWPTKEQNHIAKLTLFFGCIDYLLLILLSDDGIRHGMNCLLKLHIENNISIGKNNYHQMRKKEWAIIIHKEKKRLFKKLSEIFIMLCCERWQKKTVLKIDSERDAKGKNNSKIMTSLQLKIGFNLERQRSTMMMILVN